MLWALEKTIPMLCFCCFLIMVEPFFNHSVIRCLYLAAICLRFSIICKRNCRYSDTAVVPELLSIQLVLFLNVLHLSSAAGDFSNLYSDERLDFFQYNDSSFCNIIKMLSIRMPTRLFMLESFTNR